MISEDKWDEDIWGLEHADGSEKANIPKLYFYFGQDVSAPLLGIILVLNLFLMVCRITG